MDDGGEDEAFEDVIPGPNFFRPTRMLAPKDHKELEELIGLVITPRGEPSSSAAGHVIPWKIIKDDDNWFAELMVHLSDYPVMPGDKSFDHHAAYVEERDLGVQGFSTVLNAGEALRLLVQNPGVPDNAALHDSREQLQSLKTDNIELGAELSSVYHDAVLMSLMMGTCLAFGVPRGYAGLQHIPKTRFDDPDTLAGEFRSLRFLVWSELVPEPEEPEERAAPSRKRGRPSGVGSHADADAPLVAECRRRMRQSPGLAKSRVVRDLYDEDPTRFAGSGTEESKRKRVERKLP